MRFFVIEDLKTKQLGSFTDIFWRNLTTSFIIHPEFCSPAVVAFRFNKTTSPPPPERLRAILGMNKLRLRSCPWAATTRGLLRAFHFIQISCTWKIYTYGRLWDVSTPFYRASACLCMHSAILFYQLCLSVCLSVQCRCCVQTNKHIVMRFWTSGRDNILVFWTQAPSQNSKRNPLCVVAKYKGIGKFSKHRPLPRNGTR